ncbi:MAG: hypothetical protein DMG32_12790 [Acidobacteria bacterium]|nr:MAG: hypothetical protein DMG32_12790 [Acidobacteriota bacterium]
MTITKKFLSRRAVLHGLGATVALPLLDSMVPAFASVGSIGAQPVKRLGAVYVPNGMSMGRWLPATEGALEITPILAPLTPVRDSVLLLSGMANHEARPLLNEGDGDHSRCQAAFLTGAHARKAAGKNTTLEVGMSMDQIAARQLGKETQLASLELSLEANDLVGQCEDGYGCAYSATLAWRDANTPLPMETNPRAVFEHLFGAVGSTEREARLRGFREDRSILDSVGEELTGLQRTLGGGDRSKLAGYLDSVRDIERRIQIAEAQKNRELPEVAEPAGIPDNFEEYANLMFDLMLISYQSDLTRVCTFLVGREKSVRTYSEVGVPDAHHAISHHQEQPALLEKLAKINTYHMRIFGKFLEKMRATPDGDGSLLDHSMIIYGAGMSNSNAHIPENLPIVVVGGGAGQLQGGRHVRLPQGTPLSNLHVTLLDKMGIPIEHLGDSTAEVRVLSDV